MKLLNILIGGVLTVSSLAWAQGTNAKPPSEKTATGKPKPTDEQVIEFVNSSSSLSHVLEMYQKIGLLGEEDRQDILSFLEEQKVDTKKSLPPVKLVKGLYTTSGRSGFKFTEGLGFQTARGRIIKMEKAENIAELYRRLYLAGMEDMRFSWWDQLLPKAHAAGPSSRDEVALEALTIVPRVALGWASNRFEGAFAYAIGGAVATKNFLTSALYKGTVECQGAKYILIAGYSSKRVVLPDMEPAAKCASLRKQGKLLFYGSKDSCEYVEKGADYMAEALDMEEDRLVITDKKLAQIFKPAAAPPCNGARSKANANKVQEALKNDFEKLQKLVPRAQKYNRTSEPEVSSQGAH